MTTPLPRDEFAVTQRYVYLNHAAVGCLPRSSVAAIEAFLAAHAQAGVLGTWPYDERMIEYREAIGRFIGASGAEIATTTNTSDAANLVAIGIDWRAGDRVLLCDNEFPSNAIPWVALRRRGVEVALLPAQSQRLTPDVLARAIDRKTRVVAVSWVSYADGYRHDLAGLAEVAHAAGAWLCVDVIQGLGAFPLDVRAAGIDAAYGGAGKWMLGLHGIGFLYLGPALMERLELATPGWRSVADMWDFHNYEQAYAPEAMRFEGGTPNIVGAISLDRSIALLDRAVPSRIAAHVLALTDRLHEGLRRLGARIAAPRGDGVSSGIVTFSLPGVDSVALGRALGEHGVVTTFRANGIRVSPHGYNTAEEIDRLLELVPQCAVPVAANV
ncbi:MAG TPA: aminotransferase class V-fold PLP-dependent enzyme [Candidatus Acidoferrales bacterium]|nr:aminotransferase class V-fold PLP-dependent enzyme [Candidatus Acidoferrales bacterium]